MGRFEDYPGLVGTGVQLLENRLSFGHVGSNLTPSAIKLLEKLLSRSFFKSYLNSIISEIYLYIVEYFKNDLYVVLA